jgi:hypothetical protein
MVRNVGDADPLLRPALGHLASRCLVSGKAVFVNRTVS